MTWARLGGTVLLVVGVAGCVHIFEQLERELESDAVACTSEDLVAVPAGQVGLQAWYLPRGPGQPSYSWSVSAGSLDGDGPEVVWRMEGAPPGTERAVVSVSDDEGFVGTCSLEVTVRPFLPTAVLGPLPDRGILLGPDEEEEEGFRLYTYLVFPQPPSAAARNRFETALQVFLRVRGNVDRARPQPGGGELAFYLPLTDVDLPEVPGSDPDWFFSNYDYLRARAALNAFEPAERSGPYLVSTPVPIGQAEEAVVNDLTRAPDHLIEAWIRYYVYMAAREPSWGDRLRRTVVLRLRTVIAIMAEGVPEVVEGVDTAIRTVSRLGAETPP